MQLGRFAFSGPPKAGFVIPAPGEWIIQTTLPAAGRWIPRPSFQTCLLQAGAALPPRPGGHPSRGGELEPLRRLVPDADLPPRLLVPDAALPPTSMQAGLRRNDGGATVRHLSMHSRGCRNSDKPIPAPRSHSSAGWNPGGEAGVVNEGQVLPDGTSGCRACGCHSRLRGNGLHKPLDSGFRRNDGGGCGQVFVRNGKGLSGWQPTCSLPVVIPAQAGIQEGGPEGCRHSRFCQMARPVVVPVIVIPVHGENDQAQAGWGSVWSSSPASAMAFVICWRVSLTRRRSSASRMRGSSIRLASDSQA